MIFPVRGIATIPSECERSAEGLRRRRSKLILTLTEKFARSGYNQSSETDKVNVSWAYLLEGSPFPGNQSSIFPCKRDRHNIECMRKNSHRATTQAVEINSHLNSRIREERLQSKQRTRQSECQLGAFVRRKPTSRELIIDFPLQEGSPQY